MSTTVSIGSFNILNEYHAVKWGDDSGLNEVGKQESSTVRKQALKEGNWKIYSNWETRLPLIVDNIRQVSIACLQEVNQDRLNDILQALKGEDGQATYMLAAQAISKDKKDPSSDDPGKFFGNAILYQSSDVKCLSSTHYPRELSIDSGRGSAVADLEVSGRVIRVASCHLAGYWPGNPNFEKKEESKKQGFEQVKALHQFMESDELNGISAIVIAGDFNEDPSESASSLYRVAELKQQGYFSDGNSFMTEPPSVRRPDSDRRIDYIMVKSLDQGLVVANNMHLEEQQLDVANLAMAQASDHLMTGTQLKLT